MQDLMQVIHRSIFLPTIKLKFKTSYSDATGMKICISYIWEQTKFPCQIYFRIFKKLDASVFLCMLLSKYL